MEYLCLGRRKGSEAFERRIALLNIISRDNKRLQQVVGIYPHQKITLHKHLLICSSFLEIPFSTLPNSSRGPSSTDTWCQKLPLRTRAAFSPSTGSRLPVFVFDRPAFIFLIFPMLPYSGHSFFPFECLFLSRESVMEFRVCSSSYSDFVLEIPPNASNLVIHFILCDKK